MVEWIDAATASERLGVKPATLYAYVSRGVLSRRHSDDGRRSLFSAEEIEQLARRGRPRSQPPELVIESALTALGVDRPYYRGIDALSLARTTPFETVAEWLWTGDRTLWHTPRPSQSGPPAAHDGTPPVQPHARETAPSSGPHAGDGRPPERSRTPEAGRPTLRPATDDAEPSVRSRAGGDGGRPAQSGIPGADRPSVPPGTPEGRGPSDTPEGGGPSVPSGTPQGEGPSVRSGTPEGDGAARVWGSEVWRCEPEEGLRAAVAAQRGLPADLLPLDRLQVVTTVLGASDSLRYQLDPASVAATGRRLIAGLVDALPLVGDPPQGGSIAERLWPRLCPHPATPALLGALRAALVLLADHELAASTLAARVAASAKADPYAVVLTGLGVLGGPLHGGAAYGAERLLAEIAEPGQAARAIAERVRRGERIPGFGHSVYKNGDGRGGLLLDLVRDAAPGHERIAAVDAVLDEMRRRRLPDRNIDFALAALAAVTGMVSGAGEAIFAVARVAGWLAHAMEEYERGSLLRLRASYTGPPIA
ncbi:citrate/2-methylcitrate synthase [Nonomuraea sp. MTCD27]|uniref:citrate synthase n=1 Tax=Nonomuraea sp. MTCD27 TaxID=1676747 RepID=UPI0035BEB7CC